MCMQTPYCECKKYLCIHKVHDCRQCGTGKYAHGKILHEESEMICMRCLEGIATPAFEKVLWM